MVFCRLVILPVPACWRGELTTCSMSWTVGAGWDFGTLVPCQWEGGRGKGMGAVTRSEVWVVGWVFSV